MPADVAGSRPGNSWQMRLLSRTCDTFKNNKCSPKRGSKFKTPAGLTLPVDRGQSRGTLCVVEVSEPWFRLLAWLNPTKSTGDNSTEHSKCKILDESEDVQERKRGRDHGDEVVCAKRLERSFARRPPPSHPALRGQRSHARLAVGWAETVEWIGVLDLSCGRYGVDVLTLATFYLVGKISKGNINPRRTRSYCLPVHHFFE